MALEMARQLMREGEEVSLLALLDTERPSALRAFLADVRLLYRRGEHIADVISDILRPNGRSRKEIIRNTIRRKLGAAPSVPDAPPVTDRSYDLKIGYRRLGYSYRLAKYPGRVTLIVNERAYRIDKDLGWKGVATGGLTIHRVPGDHDTALTLHGKEFGRLLRMCIDQALPDAGAAKPTVDGLP